MKPIYLVANIRFPTEKGHGLQIVRNCQNLAEAGAKVTLIIPERPNEIKTPWQEFYNLPNPSFEVVRLPMHKLLPTALGYHFFQYIFSKKVSKYLKDKPTGVIYTRDEHIAFYMRNIGMPIFWEAHLGYMNYAIKYMLPKLAGVITITKNLAELYKHPRTLVAPSGYDPKSFQNLPRKDEARNKLGISVDKKVIVFTGHLYEWKGPQILAQAATSLGDDYAVYIVGGTKEDVAAFTAKYGHIPNVHIEGYKAPAVFPLYLAAADMLCIPNVPIHQTSELYTSPMKLFEDMAAGKPIIASDIPSIKEVLDDSTAYFVPAGDVTALAQMITRVAATDTGEKGRKAQEVVKQYAAPERAKKLLAFMN